MFLTGGQTAEFGRIAERHPQLMLIIDHMGVSTATLRAGKMPEAVAQSAALAKFPNVSVKLSSAPLFSSEPYPWRDVTPHIQRLYDAFGRAAAIGAPTSQLLRQGDLPPARRSFQRGTRIPVRGGQGLDHGQGDR